MSVEHKTSFSFAAMGNKLIDSATPTMRDQTSSLGEICALLGITAQLESHQHLRFQQVRVLRDQTLYHLGDPFGQLYAVKAGALKSVVLDPNSREQVLGFSMKGSLVGVDGIAYDEHMVETLALCDSELIILHLSTLKMLGTCCPGLSRGIYYATSGELARVQSVNMRRGLSTKAKLGRFLLDLGDRFAALGYARSVFTLPMPALGYRRLPWHGPGNRQPRAAFAGGGWTDQFGSSHRLYP